MKILFKKGNVVKVKFKKGEGVYWTEIGGRLFVLSPKEAIAIKPFTIVEVGDAIIPFTDLKESRLIKEASIDSIVEMTNLRGRILNPPFVVDNRSYHIVDFDFFGERQDIPVLPADVHKHLNGEVLVSKDGRIVALKDIVTNDYLYFIAGFPKKLFENIFEVFAKAKKEEV